MSLPVLGQDAQVIGTTNSEARNQLGLLLGHAHIPDRYSDGKKEWSVLPSFTLYYNYRFAPKWAVGLHTDLVIENFKVEKEVTTDGISEILERERPVAPAIIGIFKPGEHFGFLLGAGGEWAKGADFFLIRTEVAYSLEMAKTWEFEVSLGADFRWNAYNTINLAIGAVKSF